MLNFHQQRPVFALKNHPRPQRPKRPKKAKKGHQRPRIFKNFEVTKGQFFLKGPMVSPKKRTNEFVFFFFQNFQKLFNSSAIFVPVPFCELVRIWSSFLSILLCSKYLQSLPPTCSRVDSHCASENGSQNICIIGLVNVQFGNQGLVLASTRVPFENLQSSD